jgi:hypothetical protein
MTDRARPRDSRADQEAHDVLAAEEFGVPAPDPSLHHGPITLPDDPTGITEPHDVLAAEEFALPAPRYGANSTGFPRAPRRSHRTLVVVVALTLLALRRRRRNRSS